MSPRDLFQGSTPSRLVAVLGLVLALALAACGTDEPDVAPEPAPDVGVDDDDEPGPDEPEPPDTDAPDIAGLSFGTTADAGFNALGFLAVQGIGEQHGVRTGFSEQVPVADATRVAREYIGDGFEVILLHGGVYLPLAGELAEENPDIVFISHGSDQLEDPPPNQWHIGRGPGYNSGFYLNGYLAGRMTETGTVAFLGAIDFPDAIAAVNSFFLGARDANPDVNMLHTFTGDWDDPVIGRRAAEALIAEGADVIVAFVDEAITGIAEAARGAPHPVYFTTQYTNKPELSPDHYLVSAVWNFPGILDQIYEGVLAGETGGYIEVSPVTGGTEMGDLYNVPPEIEEEVRGIFEEFVTGGREIPSPPNDEIQDPDA